MTLPVEWDRVRGSQRCGGVEGRSHRSPCSHRWGMSSLAGQSPEDNNAQLTINPWLVRMSVQPKK